MQSSKARVLGTINKIIERSRRDLEQLAARAAEPSRDVQVGAKMAANCLSAMEKLSDRIPLREFLERLDVIQDLGRSAHDIAAGRYYTTEEVRRRLTWRRKLRRARAKAKKSRRRNGAAR